MGRADHELAGAVAVLLVPLVAAAAFGGAARDADVVAPGGTQRVEWKDDGVYLTGWAEVVCAGQWLRQIPRTSA